VHDELRDIWSGVQAELRRAVSEENYEAWLEGLALEAFDDEVAVLLVPDEKHRWVSERFARVLQTSAAAVLGPAVTIELLRRSQASQDRRRQPGGIRSMAPGETRGDIGAAGPGAPVARGSGVPRGGVAGFEAVDTVNPKHTFDQFVIGTTNRMAHASALAVAEQPGQAYNPLFIYGPPGLGKTHLLHSIANYIREHGDGLSVRCATVEEFTNAFVGAVQKGNTEAFKRRFRDTDVLLIDDVQFLESKARTEEEFFHTFNALYEAGAQLVLTSDRLPRDMEALASRLRDRFEAGLVTDIHPPDFATRLTILRKRARHDGVDLADESALEVIADRVTDNIRSLEGALIRVVAFSSLKRRPVDASLATEVLDTLAPRAATPGRRHSIRDVQQAACEAFDLSLEELLSETRTNRVVWPRQVAMYLARELTDATLPTIARQFRRKNHTTVMHACARTGERIAADPDAYAEVEALTKSLARDTGSADRPGGLGH
jgi:chromosomal replication initiator protein